MRPSCRAALAAAIGVPSPAAAFFRMCSCPWPDLDSPPAAGSLPIAEVRRAALINRFDVRSALAQYAAAEADLRLQIAKQYPDLDIGPGYTYEEKQSYFTLGFSAIIPMFDRNRGPIAEAEAGRLKAAAAFLATQAEVISKSERSLAVYRVALEELAEGRAASGTSRQTGNARSGRRCARAKGGGSSSMMPTSNS